MSKLIAVGSAMMLIVMLALLDGAFAATIRAPSDTSSADSNVTDGNVTDDSATKKIKNLELVMTVIKNEKPEVSGNLFGGIDATSFSLNLLDSPSGNYGFLDISADGAFRYILRNDAQQVQALGFNEFVEESFHYQFMDTSGNTTDAKLTLFILGNPSVSFDNIEIEFNNSSSSANPIHAGNAFQEGQHMRGQLTTSGDRDWFVFNSLGNEIIHVELCPEDSQCVDEKGWVLYVFDADKLQQSKAENETVPLRRFIDRTNETLSVFEADHMYLLHDKGIFDDLLIGIIDPCFGDRRTVDIGVGSTATPKNYVVAITSPLARSNAVDSLGNIINNGEGCGSGDVVLEREVAALPDGSKIFQQFITAFPFSDDQYTLKVTRTGVDPFAVIPPNNALFDAVGRKLSIAKMRINEQLFAVELEQLTTTAIDSPAVFAIQSMKPLNEALATDPFLPTYNPANQIVKFPQILDVQSGNVFSVEMQYQPNDNTLVLLKAAPVN